MHALAAALVLPLAAKLSDPDGGRDYLQIQCDVYTRPTLVVELVPRKDPRSSIRRWHELLDPLVPDLEKPTRSTPASRPSASRSSSWRAGAWRRRAATTGSSPATSPTSSPRCSPRSRPPRRNGSSPNAGAPGAADVDRFVTGHDGRRGRDNGPRWRAGRAAAYRPFVRR